MDGMGEFGLFGFCLVDDSNEVCSSLFFPVFNNLQFSSHSPAPDTSRWSAWSIEDWRDWKQWRERERALNRNGTSFGASGNSYFGSTSGAGQDYRAELDEEKEQSGVVHAKKDKVGKGCVVIILLAPKPMTPKVINDSFYFKCPHSRGTPQS